jgi:ankyrin repeat protein
MGHKAIVEMLLRAGADPNAKGNLVGCAPRAALMMNHKDVLQILLEQKTDRNDADQWYGTPLHEASLTGQFEMVSLLLESGANPNVQGGIFGTALLASAWEGTARIVELLLQKGADLNAQEYGKTALYLADAAEHTEVIDTLCRAAENHRADIERCLRGVAAGQGDVVPTPDNEVFTTMGDAPPAETSKHDNNIIDVSPLPEPLLNLQQYQPRSLDRTTGESSTEPAKGSSRDSNASQDIRIGSKIAVRRKMMCEDLDLLQQDRWQDIYRSHKAEGRARLLAAL